MMALRCFGVQSHTQCPGDPEDRRKSGVAVGAQCFIQTLAAQPRLAGDLRHSLRTCDIAQRTRDARGVIRRLGKPRIQISGHLPRRAQVFGDIVRQRFGLNSFLGCFGNVRLLLKIFCKLQRQPNVALLRRLRASSEKNDEFRSALRVVDAVTGTDIDLQLRHAAGQPAMLAGIPVGEAVDAHLNRARPARSFRLLIQSR